MNKKNKLYNLFIVEDSKTKFYVPYYVDHSGEKDKVVNLRTDAFYESEDTLNVIPRIERLIIDIYKEQYGVKSNSVERITYWDIESFLTDYVIQYVKNSNNKILASIGKNIESNESDIFYELYQSLYGFTSDDSKKFTKEEIVAMVDDYTRLKHPQKNKPTGQMGEE